MNKNPQYNQQSNSEGEEICICQNIESGRHSIYIWKWWDSCQNPEQQYLKTVSFSDPSFSKKCIYVYDHAA